MTYKTKKKVGLALGGGAARGIAHIGVLKAFVEHKIPIDFIAATSAGAVGASFYAAGLSIDKIVEIAENLTWKNFSRFKLSRKGLVSSKPIEELIEKHAGKITFKDLSLPVNILVTDILTGEGVQLNDPDMKVALAVRASASFPGIYEPIEINNRYFCDGGAAFNLPCKVVREMGADIVIGVNVIPQVQLKTLPINVATLVDRGLDILLNSSLKFLENEAEIILSPITERMTSFSVKKGKKLIELGYNCVIDNLNKIKMLLDEK